MREGIRVDDDGDLMLWSRAKAALRARARKLGADVELRRVSRSWHWFATWGDRREPVFLGGDLAQASATLVKIERAIKETA